MNEYLQALVNKVFPKEVLLFSNGVFGLTFNNGVYDFASNVVGHTAFSVGTDLTATTDTNHIGTTLVSNDLVDFTNYNTVEMLTNFGTVTLDVSAFSGSGYLCVYSVFYGSKRHLGVCVSSAKQYFGNNAIDALDARVYPTSSSIAISKITLK